MSKEADPKHERDILDHLEEHLRQKKKGQPNPDPEPKRKSDAPLLRAIQKSQ